MTKVYATITAKGQITLPASARRALGLRSGQKVAIRVEGEHLIIEAPHDLASIRARLRAAAEASGTLGSVPQSSDGWAASVMEKHGQP